MLGPPDIISQYAPCVTLYVLAQSLNPHDTGPFTDMCSCAAGAFGALVFVDLSSCPFDPCDIFCDAAMLHLACVFTWRRPLLIIPDAGVAFVPHLHAHAPLTSIRLCVASPVSFRLRLLFCAGTQDGFDHVA